MRYLTPLSFPIAGLALCGGLVFAICNAWVCDDAFISFRYAKNLVDGHGLVYNAGEFVEGYTNFLWVMCIALGMFFGADPILLGQVLGIGFFVATVGVLGIAAVRARTFPVAAIGLAMHEHTLIFSSCGLETSMFTFLVTAGLVQLIVAERPGQFGRGGLALILATMTRPDGALFYALASGVVLTVARHRRDWRPLVAYAAPFVLLYLPYFVWKLDYYGYPFPNTFYAKSASRPYLGQGLYYVRLYLQCYYYLIPALLIPVWFVVRPRSSGGTDFDGRRGPLLIALFVLAYLAYVVFVGGDFMFSRFCLPVTPALLLGLQYLARDRGVAWGVTGLVLVGSLLPAYPAKALAGGNAQIVVEEKKHYPGWYVVDYRIFAAKLREVFAGGDLCVAIGGGQAMLAYFGEFSRVIELNGLTDEFIAHRVLSNRGRVGHEKLLPLDHPYLRERGVDVVVGPFAHPFVPNDELGAQRELEIDVENVFFRDQKFDKVPVKATLLTYDAALLQRASGRADVRFPSFPEYLDGYIRKLDQLSVDRVRNDLRAFRGFYFDHTDDPERLRRIQDYIESR